jgi:hypothetical protein
MLFMLLPLFLSHDAITRLFQRRNNSLLKM